MRGAGSPVQRRIAKATPMMMYLSCLMHVEAITANRDEVLRFAMVFPIGATKAAKLPARMMVWAA